MGYLLGVDEAGYGPNLGPLVISITIWEAPDKVRPEDLFDRLAHIISQRFDAARRNVGPRLVMADSKLLYSSGNGLGRLERGLLAALGLLGFRPRTWREIWQMLSPEALDAMATVPWYADYDEPAPLDCRNEEIDSLVDSLRAGLVSVGVRLIGVQSRVIFEPQFNDLIDRYGSKGVALSQQTLALAAGAINQLPAGEISLVCDKHGGRNRYAPLLMQHFPGTLIEVRRESRQRSEYQFGPPERRVDVCFRTQAESCLPVALASMASKYLRELAMRALNEFWGRRVPGLKPTAGYPQDAKRFRLDIAETQARLHIDNRLLWRVV